MTIRDQLRHDAVFGRTENGGVQRHKKKDDEHKFDARREERGQTEQHDENLEALYREQDSPLAAAIGEAPGVAGEEQEGKDEDGAREGEVFAGGAASGRHMDRTERNGHFVQVVVEGAEELRLEKRREARFAVQLFVSARFV